MKMRSCLLLVCSMVLLIPVYVQGQRREVHFDDSDMARDLEEALTFRKYPTYAQYVEMMNHFATDYPEICRLDTFGTSVEGRLLLALNISANAGQEEPEATFLYTSSMHGNEVIGYVLLLRLAHFLLTGYGNDVEVDRLLENLSIWINPLANPDGTFSADSGRSLLNSQRYNARDVDLNRNYPDPGTGEPDDTTGRERENRLMMQFMKEQGFTLSANLHSGAEVVNYPWDFTYALHADDDWYRFVSREYADEARAVDPDYMGLFLNGITNGAEWFVITGGRQDYVNYYLEGREVTLELSDLFLVDSDELEDYWIVNQRSLINYMSQCLYGIRGTVTDSVTGAPVSALVSIPGHDSTYSVVHSSPDFGDFYRLIKEGVYDVVVSSPGYLADTLTGVEVTDYQATLLEVELVPEVISGLEKAYIAPWVRIYPNPATGRVFIDPKGFEPGVLSVKVYSLTGQLLRDEEVVYGGRPMEWILSRVGRGMIYIRVSDGEMTRTGKIFLSGH